RAAGTQTAGTDTAAVAEPDRYCAGTTGSRRAGRRTANRSQPADGRHPQPVAGQHGTRRGPGSGTRGGKAVTPPTVKDRYPAAASPPHRRALLRIRLLL